MDIEVNAMLRIQTETMTVLIEPQTAWLCSLVSDRGEELIKEATHAPFFEVVALDGENQKHVFRPREGVQTDEKTLSFQGLYEQELRADFSVRLCVHAEDSSAIAVELTLDNADQRYTPVEMVALQIEGLTLGQNPENNVALYPHHAGERIVNPAQTLRTQKYRDFWRAGTQMENGRYVRENNYCGLMSMTWMFLQNPEYGLYLGSHDERFPVTGMRMLTGGESWLGFGYRVYHRVHAGESFAYGRFVLALGHEDWHAGAHRYRRYINPYLFPHEVPPFLREEAALHQCYQFKRADGIYNRFADIPKLFDRGSEQDIRHMFIASWNRTGFDSNYPEYYPDMELGTALDFRRGLQYVTDHGGFTTLYVNARIFDRKSDFYPTYGTQMEIRDENQQPRTESYAPNTFTLNCPADSRWQHDLTDICDFTAQAYGAKGIYLDQLASAEPFPCYHEGHDHPNIDEFNRGYVKVLSDLLARLKARDPDAYLMTENCGDIYSAYTWGSLTWNGTDYDEFFNLFRYTFPEYMQVNMVNTRSWEPDPKRKEAYFYSDIQRCLLMGNILWIGLCSRFENPAVSVERAYLLKAAALRKRIAPWIAKGIYLDDEYVSERFGAEASCWRVSDGEALLLIGNAEAKEDGCVSFALPFTAGRVAGDDEEGLGSATVECHENRLTVHTGTKRLTAIHVRA